VCDEQPDRMGSHGPVERMTDGSLQASHGEFLVSGTTPGRCQGAVVQRMGNCGVVNP